MSFIYISVVEGHDKFFFSDIILISHTDEKNMVKPLYKEAKITLKVSNTTGLVDFWQ